MPKFFDDYSNTYLTHDSAAGRKQQRRGWKFRENFKLHYSEHLKEWRSGQMGLAAAQQDYIKSNTQNESAIPPLPEGWEEKDDEATKLKYYVNTKTQERTWVRPGFIPPAIGRGSSMMQQPRRPPPPSMNNNMNNNMHRPGPGAIRPPPMGNFPPPPMGNFPPPPGSFPPPGGPGAFPPPPGNMPPPMHGLPPPRKH